MYTWTISSQQRTHDNGNRVGIQEMTAYENHDSHELQPISLRENM